MMTRARNTRSAHVVSLLLYVMIMTQLTMTSATSINKINYGISFQQLRASKIAMSEYVCDYIITLPYNTIEHKNELIPTCN